MKLTFETKVAAVAAVCIAALIVSVSFLAEQISESDLAQLIVLKIENEIVAEKEKQDD